MDLASVVAALASVGVRVSGSAPNSSVQVDSSRACPPGLAGPEPSGTIHDLGQHFHALGGLNWFQAFCYENSVLRDIALRVHSTPTVASAAERNWSVFGFVHSKSRNSLYGHKVEKLVHIYQNMRLLRKIRDAAFREPCVLPDHMFDDDAEEEE